MKKRFGEMKSNDRQTTCRVENCKATIEIGQQRYWDNHKDVNGPVCVSCAARGGLLSEIDDSDVAAPRGGGSKKDIDDIKQNLLALKYAFDSLTIQLNRIEASIDEVKKIAVGA